MKYSRNTFYKNNVFQLFLFYSVHFRCFTLFDELDHISVRFKKLQTDIIKRYASTCIEYKDETFVDMVNSMTPTKLIELPLSVEVNEDKSIDNINDESGDKSPDALNEVNY